MQFLVQAAVESLPRLRVRARVPGAAPLDAELPFSLTSGRNHLPLREGHFHLALQTPDARHVAWSRLRTAAPETKLCEGAIACAEGRESPWPGAVFVTLTVRALPDVDVIG